MVRPRKKGVNHSSSASMRADSCIAMIDSDPLEIRISMPGFQILVAIQPTGGQNPGMKRQRPRAAKERAAQSTGIATDGIDHPDSQPPIADDIEAWRRDMATRLGYSATHVRKSVAAVREIAAAAGVGYTDQIRRSDILAWLQDTSEAGGGARKTARNKASQLKAFCDWAVMLGRLRDNPATGVRLPRAVRRPGAVPFSVDEVQRLILEAERQEASHGRAGRFGPMRSTFYGFLTWTGLRYGEARRQRWADVDLDGAALTVSEDKAGRRDTIPLSREAVAGLRVWRVWSRGDLVFPVAPSHHTLVADMRRCGIPGLSTGPRGQWHRFRKCAVTARARAGAPMRELHKFARHTDASMTAAAYDFAAVDELRACAELLPALNGFIDRAKKSELFSAQNSQEWNSGGRLRYYDCGEREGTESPTHDKSTSGPAPADPGPDPVTFAKPDPSASERPASGRSLIHQPPASASTQWSRGDSTSGPDDGRGLDARRLALAERLIALAEQLMAGGELRNARTPDSPSDSSPADP